MICKVLSGRLEEKARWWSDDIGSCSERWGDQQCKPYPSTWYTSIKEQGPDDAKVQSAEFVPSDVVQEVRVFSKTLAEFRVGEIAQLLEELGIEARRRRGTRAARAPRARARTALRRDAPEPRPSAPPALRRRWFPYTDRHSFYCSLISHRTPTHNVSNIKFHKNWQDKSFYTLLKPIFILT